MILIGVLLAATLVGLAAFWKALITWLKRVIEQVGKMIGAVVEGVKTFIVRLSDGIKNVAKSYSKNKVNGAWEETISRKSVAERDIPPELIARVNAKLGKEVDTTEELLAELKN